MGVDITVPCGDGIVNGRVGAIRLKDGKFLMAGNRRFDYLYSVGGRIQFGETAQEAVIREVREETGRELELDRLGFVHESFFQADFGAHRGKLFYEIAFYFYMKTPRTLSRCVAAFPRTGRRSSCAGWLPMTPGCSTRNSFGQSCSIRHRASGTL